MTQHSPLPSREWLMENLRYEPETGLFWWARRGYRRQMNKPVGSKHYRSAERGGEPHQVAIKLQGKLYAAHRLAWPMMTGEDPGCMTIDHINRNPFDNRWENLRLADNSLQGRNKNKTRGCSSSYKGVQFKSDIQKWRAYASADRRQKHLGYFATEEEAAAAAAPHYIP